MYNLSELYDLIGPSKRAEIWDNRIACALADKKRVFATNLMQDAAACFSFTLIQRGHLQMESNGKIVECSVNDILVYMPGFSVKILSVSDDYEAIVLLVDEQRTYHSPMSRDVVSVASLPLILASSPTMTLSDENAQAVSMLMRRIRKHILQPNYMTDKLLQMYYSAFITELTVLHVFAAARGNFSKRTENVFVRFYSLMRQNFIEHRDLAFYAGSLHITTTYLSRALRELTGQTVIALIDRMLLNESVWLLQTTELSITEIAYKLQFSSPAAFCKFFHRMTAKTPKEYRNS